MSDNLGADITRTRKRLLKLEQRIMRRMSKEDPVDLPEITENEERAHRSITRTLTAMNQEAKNSQPRLEVPLSIDITKISTEELKAALAAEKDKE